MHDETTRAMINAVDSTKKQKPDLFEDVQELEIGKYNICADVNENGDLQLRVYPIGKDGQYWDAPIDTFDVYKSEVDAFKEED